MDKLLLQIRILKSYIREKAFNLTEMFLRRDLFTWIIIIATSVFILLFIIKLAITLYF